MTRRITAAWVGSIILAPPLVAAQPEDVEPEPVPEACPQACCWDPSPTAYICSIFDLLAFQSAFVANDPCAINMDTSTGIGVGDIFDFLVFQNEFLTVPPGGWSC